VTKEYVPNGRGYIVPCNYNIKGSERTVCVVIHGFGSSKESTTAAMLLKELPLRDIGAIALDLPAHGESPVQGEFLRLSNCIADIEATEARARELAPEAEIVYFASSFGAYSTLLYLAGKEQTTKLRGAGRNVPRAFLRSAAVSMPRLFFGRLTPERKAQLETVGEFTIRKEEYSYTRNMKITQGFFDDLAGNDVFDIWREGIADLRMIHGQYDDAITLSDATSFAEKFKAPLTVVENGDHQLSVPGAAELVLELALEFFQ